MAKFFRNLIQYMLSAYFVLTIYKGITLPTNPIYFISSLAILSILVFLASAILNFLTIKVNFITNFVMTTLLCVGGFFLLQEFLPGFNIEEYAFEGINTGNLVIHSFPVTVLLSMIIESVTHSLLCSILKVLEKSS